MGRRLASCKQSSAAPPVLGGAGVGAVPVPAPVPAAAAARPPATAALLGAVGMGRRGRGRRSRRRRTTPGRPRAGRLVLRRQLARLRRHRCRFYGQLRSLRCGILPCTACSSPGLRSRSESTTGENAPGRSWGSICQPRNRQSLTHSIPISCSCSSAARSLTCRDLAMPLCSRCLSRVGPCHAVRHQRPIAGQQLRALR